MTLNKKKVLVVSLALCLIAILSFGTLAWFNASDEITNQFMVTDSETDPDEIFSVDVYETAVEEDGKTVKDADGDGEADITESGNVYDDIVPGVPYIKDPTVKNTGKYDQWVRVNVTIDEAEDWQAIFADYGITDLSTVFQNHNETVWTRYDAPAYDSTAKTLTYTYYLNDILEPGETVVLFDGIKLPEVLTQADMAKVSAFNIKVVAQAIQAEGTGDTALEAFDKY